MRILGTSGFAAGITLLLAAGCGIANREAGGANPPDLGELIAQVEGKSCEYSWPEACSVKPPGFFQFLNRGLPHARHSCILAAARCMEKMGPAAAPAVPALLRALRDGPNDYDTGDGVIAVRSGVASALAATRDHRAIDALGEALRTARPAERSISASPSNGRPAARHAILRALASFGPAAAKHWEAAAEVLRQRNADRGYLDRQRQYYEMSAATRIASKAIEAQQPGQTSFVVPQEAIEAARAKLDRNSQGYVREFESHARDSEAAAAADALGQFQAAEAAPVLVETLENFAAAESAAMALARLGASPAGVGEALRRVLESDRYGPRARAAAARALGALGVSGAVPAIAAGLEDEELAEAAAKALGELGASARGAVPALVALLREPPLDQASVEATRRQMAKSAAARAVASIDPATALDVLPAWLFERDAGSTVQELLVKLDPRGERIVAAVAGHTASKDPERRRRAVRFLGRFRSAAPVPVLARALEDPDAAVRRGAAGSLRRIGVDAARALPALRAALARTADDAERKELERAIAAIATL